MWKIIALFFRRKANPDQFPEIIQKRIFEIIQKEELPANFITFRRSGLNIFSMENCDQPSGWNFFFDSLEID
jgi:hypothetical protein